MAGKGVFGCIFIILFLKIVLKSNKIKAVWQYYSQNSFNYNNVINEEFDTYILKLKNKITFQVIVFKIQLQK